MDENKKKIQLYKKLSPEDLEGYLHLRRRGGKIPPKKGKGAPYKRNKREGFEE